MDLDQEVASSVARLRATINPDPPALIRAESHSAPRKARRLVAAAGAIVILSTGLYFAVMQHRGSHPVTVTSISAISSSTSPAHSYVSPGPNCGFPYEAFGPTGDVYLGTCATLLGPTAVETIHLQVGQTFSISASREQNGSPTIPLPPAGNSGVVTRSRVSADQTRATYTAVSAGAVILRVRTLHCIVGDEIQTVRSCPAVRVVVQARS
jgi:hypothetical protein